MNRIIFLSMILLLLFSCSAQEKDIQIQLETIIEDPLYVELREQDKLEIRNHLNGLYNFKKIDKVFDSNNVYSSTCDWDLGDFKNDEGVKAYFQIDCKRTHLLQKIKTKYPFLKTSENKYFVEMNNLYAKKHGLPVAGDEARKILNNRKN